MNRLEMAGGNSLNKYFETNEDMDLQWLLCVPEDNSIQDLESQPRQTILNIFSTPPTCLKAIKQWHIKVIILTLGSREGYRNF